MAVIFAAMLMGCAQEEGIAGTYHLTSIEVRGRTYDKNHLEAAGYDYMKDYTVVLNADGTGSLTLQGTTVEIRYEDNALWTDDDTGRTMIYGFENGILSLRQGNMTVNLEK